MAGNHPLVDYREGKGLTQEALGKELGVSGVTVSRWETGKRKIGAGRFPAVVAKTGIPPERLRPDLAVPFQRETENAA